MRIILIDISVLSLSTKKPRKKWSLLDALTAELI
jgi:hypothetical protein